MTLIYQPSKSGEFSTPQETFDAWNAIYKFDLDVAATKENAKCKKFFTKKEDGLSQEWFGSVWCNPPYGRGIGDWIKKGFLAVGSGECDSVVFLVPSRTDVAWWHDYVNPPVTEVKLLQTKRMVFRSFKFVRGRLKFGGLEGSAPFPSVLIVFESQEGREKIGRQGTP